MGMFAKELLTGPTIPYFAYPTEHEAHELGELVNGVLIAGLFRVFGENGVTLKICWFLFHVAALTVIFLMLYRYFNLKIAVMVTVYHILAPPFFIRSNLASDVQSGALFFTLLISFMTFSLVSHPGLLRHALYAILCGFSVFYSHYCIIAISMALLYHLLYNRRFFLLKSLAVFLFFFMIGLSPWFYMNKYYNLEWFGYLVSLVPNAPLSFVHKSLGVFPRSLLFHDLFFIKGIAFDYLYFFSVISLFIAGVFSFKKCSYGEIRNFLYEKDKELFIYLFIMVYSISYIISGISVSMDIVYGYRHLLILYPFLFMAMGIWTDRIVKAREQWARRTGRVIAGLILTLGFMGSVSMIELGNSNLSGPPIYAPYSFAWLHYRIYNFTKGNPEKLNACIRSIERKYSPYALIGIYKKMQVGTLSEPMVFLEKNTMRFADYQEAYYNGIGQGVGSYYREEPIFEIEIRRNLSAAYRLNESGILNSNCAEYFLKTPFSLKEVGCRLNGEVRLRYFYKVGMSIALLKHKDIGLFLALINNFGDTLAGKLVEGYAAGITVDGKAEEVLKISKNFTDKRQQDFFLGMGFTYTLKKAPDLESIIEAGQDMDQKHREHYYKGVGKAVGWFFVNDPTLILKLIAQGGPHFDFKVREYSFLPLGLYKYFHGYARKAYCEGMGYGIAPYLSGYTAIVLTKLGKYIADEDYTYITNGVRSFYREEGSQRIDIDKMRDHNLARSIKELFSQVQ